PQLARTSDGTLWLRFQGIWRLDGEVWRSVSAGDDNLKNADMIGAAGNRLWLAETDGIRAISSEIGASAFYTSEETGFTAAQSVTFRDGHTWFAGFKRLVEFDASSWREVPLPEPSLLGISRVEAGPDGTLTVVGLARTNTSQMNLRYL